MENIKTLPFDARFQGGLIYLLCIDSEFNSSIIEELKPQHLDASESHIKLFKLVKALCNKTNTVITLPILNNYLVKLEKNGLLTEGDMLGIKNILSQAKTLIPAELDYIKTNAFDFIKKQVVAIAFSDAISFYEKNDYDNMYELISKAYKKTFSMENFVGRDYLKMSPAELYSEPPRLDVWSSGFPQFDSFIDGGFAKKECYCIISSTGRGKCLGTDTEIIMSDGTIKKVQDVVPGDKLMGPDGKARNVLSTTSGKSNLYKITPKKGTPYVVNDVHLLSLKATGSSQDLILPDKTRVGSKQAEPVFIEAETLFNANKTVKHCLKGWRPDAVSFENESSNHIIPPYIFGVWLGDGSSSKPEITQIPNEVSKEFSTYAESIGCKITKREQQDNKSYVFSIAQKKVDRPGFSLSSKNPFTEALKSLGVMDNKHIPSSYKLSSIKDRLELLAGLLDTDGSLHYNGYDFIQKNKALAEDVVFIARSLGLAANISECTKSIKKLNFSGQYWRVTISGDCDKIPVRLEYKKAEPRSQKKNHLVTGITIDRAGYGDYYGFEIDGDKQFLLGDWQVTHNTSLMCNIGLSAIKQKLKTCFITLELTDSQIMRRYDSILSGFSAREIAESPEIQIEVERLKQQKLGGVPIVKEFSRGTLSLAGLRNYLDRFCLDHGQPDVVILDWLACMKMPLNDKRHEALGALADELVNLSREYRCSLITAQQTNRSAVGNDIFGYDSVSESFSSLFGMDGVFGLGASDKAKDAGKRTLTILKNRMGPDSVYVQLIGNKPKEPLNFRFVELPPEEEEAELLKPMDEKS